MSLADAVFLAVAALLAFTACRGLKAGRFGFTHHARLATDRNTSALWFWVQFALIICTIAVLVLGATV